MANIKIKQIPEIDEIGQILHNELTGEFQKPFVTIDEDGTCLPERYTVFAEAMENFEVRNNDVWVCSFPRSGTTWTQEMVWLIGNDLDYTRAKINLNERFPYLETSTLFDFEKIDKRMGVENPKRCHDSVTSLNNLESPRFIKSHMPFPRLPREMRSGAKTPKIIYVIRNPKDVCVSLYHFYLLMFGVKPSLENFAKAFMADKAIYGSYWKHVLGYWEKQNLPNLLILKYEDMKNDLIGAIKMVANFLNKSYTNEQIEQLQKHLSFESMKNNNSVNNEAFLNLARITNILPKEGDFIRSGTTKKYKEEMSSKTIEKFDAWIKKNVSGTTFGPEFCFE